MKENEIRFEWDANKAAINRVKHGITFEEATSVFSDVMSITIPDVEHSEDEERFVIIGLSIKSNLLVVCHCLRESETVIRLISARKATRRETEQYNDY